MIRTLKLCVFVMLGMVLLTPLSCVKDNNDSPCQIKSDYYFTGTIFEEVICMNDGRNGVGINCSYILKENSSDIGVYRFGMDTYPVYRFDTWITIVTPYLKVFDYNYIWEFFEPGVKLFSDPGSVNNKQFDIEYTVISSVMGTAAALKSHYYTFTGDQTGSSINVIERTEPVSSDPDFREIRTKMLINCKLYSFNEILQEEVKDAEACLLLRIPV